VVTHPLDPEDATAIAAMRATAGSTKGMLRGTEAREPFDALMESVLRQDGVTFKSDTIGSIPGLWVHPAHHRVDEAILHLHGGWFNLGTAKAFRHLVAHIAARAGARAFVPDYRLAPEHPFPAAVDDVRPATADLMKRVSAGLPSRETLPAAILHLCSPPA
jgi:epsilon-lactone hydrolase